MIRLSLLLPFVLAACQQPEERATEAEDQLQAPVREVDEIPVDEGAAAAVGEGDDAPAQEEE